MLQDVPLLSVAVLLDMSDPEKMRTGLGIDSYPVGLVAQTTSACEPGRYSLTRAATVFVSVASCHRNAEPSEIKSRRVSPMGANMQ